MKHLQCLISDSHSESISLFNDIFVTGQVNTKKGLIFFFSNHIHCLKFLQ